MVNQTGIIIHKTKNKQQEENTIIVSTRRIKANNKAVYVNYTRSNA